MTTQSTALSTATQAQGIIRTPEDFQTRLTSWRTEHYHVLSPVATFTGMPAHFGLMAAKVEINPDPAGGEVYADPLWCKDGEVALSKNGLAKIAQAAGMSITTERMDNRMIPNLWEVKATVRFIGLDGTAQSLDATEELDLRDGTERSKKVLGQKNATGALVAARAKGLRGCEARAINAAIRLYGIRQKYHRADLLKPFMCVRVVHNPDMSDPVTRQMVTERALGGASMLYGSRAATPVHDANVIDVIGVDPTAQAALPAKQDAPVPPARLVVKVTSDPEAGTHDVTFEGGETLTTTDAAVAQVAVAAKKSGQKVRAVVGEDGLVTALEVVNGTATAAADEALRIKSIEKVTGKSGKGPWTLYNVTLSTGQVVTTFSTTSQQIIDEAHKGNLPVTVTTSENDRYPDKLNLDTIAIVDTRQGTLPGAGREGKY